MRYIVKRDYKSHVGEYRSGQILEISDSEYAAWLTRDMQGWLAEVVEKPAEPEAAPEATVAPARKSRSKKGTAHG